MSEDACIVLGPVGGMYYHAQDSVQIPADCGCTCWISPVNYAHVMSPFKRTVTICVPHLMQDPERREALRRQGSPYVFPGVRAELERELGKVETDRMFEQWHLTEWDGSSTPPNGLPS